MACATREKPVDLEFQVKPATNNVRYLSLASASPCGVFLLVRQNVVACFRTRKRVTLGSGTYDLELKGKPDGLKLDIEKVTLKRGDVKIATIVRKPPHP